MCGGSNSNFFGKLSDVLDPAGYLLAGPRGGKKEAAPVVDPSAERRAAESEAAAKVNASLIEDARRKRAQKGVGDSGNFALGGSSGSTNSTALGSGGNY